MRIGHWQAANVLLMFGSMTAASSQLQPSLPGLEGRARDRLFFAIAPDGLAGRRAGALTGRLGERFGLLGRPIARERLHLSLFHLGDHHTAPRDVVVRARAAAGAAPRWPFSVALDWAGSFASRADEAPFVLGARRRPPSLVGFQQALGDAMRTCGLGRYVGHGFTPHMTLLYDRRRVEAVDIPAISWIASELLLIHSFLGESRYEVVERWPLG
jgi:2'-5' RNA ligase